MLAQKPPLVRRECTTISMKTFFIVRFHADWKNNSQMPLRNVIEGNVSEWHLKCIYGYHKMKHLLAREIVFACLVGVVDDL